MNMEIGSLKWPLSMEHHQTQYVFPWSFGEDMLVGGLGNPFQPTVNFGSVNESFNSLISSYRGSSSSDSDEICKFLDNTLFTEKVMDNCDWIDDMIESIPFSPSISTLGDGSSSNSSLQSNCSWTHPTLCQSNTEKKAQMSPSTNSSITTASDKWGEPHLVFNSNSLDVNCNPGFLHLIKAFAEAKNDGILDLVEVISKRILEIVSPLGTSLERMGYHMFQSSETQYDYIRLESMKVSKVVFQAFSTLCLYNLFPILAANATILSSIPEGIEALHIIDFDARDGSQWLPFLEAVGSTKLVRITSIRQGSGQDYDQNCSRFGETQKHLLECAKTRGLRLVVNEMSIEEIIQEKRRMKKRGGSEFLVFNCVVGLPQIGRQRTLREAIDFMKVSKEILDNSANSRGIITFSNAIPIPGIFAGERKYDYASWFDECLLHSNALFEATGWHFPSNQVEARTAIESLILGPLVSSNTNFEKWEEIKDGYHDFASGLVGQELSNEVLNLTMELVKGQGFYETKMENRNELTLGWKGTPIITFSAWR